MAAATYYFKDGTGALVTVPVTADDQGNLTHADGRVIVTGATASIEPESGAYVLETAAAAEDEPKKGSKKKAADAADD